MKRAFSFAGRGQRTLRAPNAPEDRRFLFDALRAGGLLFEPELEIHAEYSIHGIVGPKTRLLGAPCTLRVDDYGQPSLVEREDEDFPERHALEELGLRAAEHLERAGYFGPFGLDGIVARDPADPNQLRLFASDLNARFTLGWSTGFGAARAEAISRLLAGAL